MFILDAFIYILRINFSLLQQSQPLEKNLTFAQSNVKMYLHKCNFCMILKPIKTVHFSSLYRPVGLLTPNEKIFEKLLLCRLQTLITPLHPHHSLPTKEGRYLSQDKKQSQHN